MHNENCWAQTASWVWISPGCRSSRGSQHILPRHIVLKPEVPVFAQEHPAPSRSGCLTLEGKKLSTGCHCEHYSTGDPEPSREGSSIYALAFSQCTHSWLICACGFFFALCVQTCKAGPILVSWQFGRTKGKAAG